MKVIDRAFKVSMLVFVCILFGGGLLFQNSEAGTYASTAVAFVVGPVLLMFLSTLEGRGGQRNREGPGGD
jgi:hypothetical protein